LEPSVERAADDVGIDADALGLRQDLRRLRAVVRVLDEVGALHRGAHQRSHNVRMPVGPALPDSQHLLDRAHQDVGDEMHDLSEAESARARVPGRADAEGIDMPLARLSTMKGGGSTTRRTSSSGSTPAAAIQKRNW